MTYLDLIRSAEYKLDKGNITLEEYDRMIEPLEREIQPERKQGHWLIDSDGYYPYCSECRTEPSSGHMTDFCPNCGADMRKEKN